MGHCTASGNSRKREFLVEFRTVTFSGARSLWYVTSTQQTWGVYKSDLIQGPRFSII